MVKKVLVLVFAALIICAIGVFVTVFSKIQAAKNSPSAPLFVTSGTSSYINDRGIYLFQLLNTIYYQTKSGTQRYTVDESTKTICLAAESENSWVDLTKTTESERELYKHKVDSFFGSRLNLKSGETQIIVSSPTKTNENRYGILWVIGCNL